MNRIGTAAAVVVIGVLCQAWPNFEELSRRPPVAGTVWKANFNRWDGVEPSRRMSIWSDPQNTDSWPHVPSRFGEIVFVD